MILTVNTIISYLKKGRRLLLHFWAAYSGPFRTSLKKDLDALP